MGRRKVNPEIWFALFVLAVAIGSFVVAAVEVFGARR